MVNNIIIKNIYYMLCYALDEANRNEQTVDNEEFENIYDLIAFILEQDIFYLIKRGIFKDYIEKEESLVSLHGKININESIKLKTQSEKKLFCEYDEFSENIFLNQILKSAINVLLRSGKIKEEYFLKLKRLRFYFNNVDDISLYSVNWKSLFFHRQNCSYKRLLFCCEILAECSIMSNKEGDGHILNIFFNKKWRLYEKFILGYYIRHYPDNVYRQSKCVKWAINEKIGNTSKLPSMKTDIYLYSDKKVLILDAKFYGHIMQSYGDWEGKYQSHNLYQIFTYVQNEKHQQSSKNIQGMLLYAKTEDETNLEENEYIIADNSISINILDLNQPFEKIKEKLDVIIKNKILS